jgi:hypothetical protein
MRIIKFTLLAALFASTTSSALAQDYVIKVNGIVCEFCAFGVTKKVAKLPFIDNSRYDNGVLVEVENQMVTIAVKQDASLDKIALFAAIESGGYNPVTIWKLTPDGKRIAQP